MTSITVKLYEELKDLECSWRSSKTFPEMRTVNMLQVQTKRRQIGWSRRRRKGRTMGKHATHYSLFPEKTAEVTISKREVAKPGTGEEKVPEEGGEAKRGPNSTYLKK